MFQDERHTLLQQQSAILGACMCCVILCTSFWANKIYSQHDLLDIGVCCEQSITAEFLLTQNYTRSQWT